MCDCYELSIAMFHNQRVYTLCVCMAIQQFAMAMSNCHSFGQTLLGNPQTKWRFEGIIIYP